MLIFSKLVAKIAGVCTTILSCALNVLKWWRLLSFNYISKAFFFTRKILYGGVGGCMIEMKYHLLSHVKRTIFVVLWILFATKCTYGISVNSESVFIIDSHVFLSWRDILF